MSKENKVEELKDEELEKVCGGGAQATGNCGIPTMPNSCTQYDSTSEQCKSCVGKRPNNVLVADEVDLTQVIADLRLTKQDIMIKINGKR